MRPAFAAGSFAFLIALLLCVAPLRAAGPDAAPPESATDASNAAMGTETGAGADVTAKAGEENGEETGEDTGEPPHEKFTVAGVDEAVDRFYQKTAEEQSGMMNRALDGVNKLGPEEQRQLAAVQKERQSAMSPEEAAQEARDELSSMTPEQQDSLRSQWERQLQNDPEYWKLNAKDRTRAIEQVRNFGKDVEPDIVTPPGT